MAKSLVDVAAMARTLDKLRGAGKAAVKGLKALKTGLSTAKGFTSAAGPLVIVSAAAVLAEISIANLIKIKEAEKN